MKNAHILINVIDYDAFQHKKNIIAPNHVSKSNLDIGVLGISMDFFRWQKYLQVSHRTALSGAIL